MLRVSIGGQRRSLGVGSPLLHQVQPRRLPPHLRGDGLLEELLHGGNGRAEHLEHLHVLVGLAAVVPARKLLVLTQVDRGLGLCQLLRLQPVRLGGEAAAGLLRSAPGEGARDGEARHGALASCPGTHRSSCGKHDDFAAWDEF